MKIKTKWIWSLWEGLLMVVPLVLLFINWKWGVIALAFSLMLFVLWCILILWVGLNTRCSFGVARLIHLNDSRLIQKEDQQRIDWIETQGTPMKLETPDGLILEGRFLDHPNSKGLVYICHGFGDYQYVSIEKPAAKFYEMGYSVFVSHSRGFSKNSGSWSGMGVLERADHIQWLQTLQNLKQFPQIFLYGVSMGGASVMNLCDLKEDLPIKGIIEDCGYVDLYDQMEHSMRSILQVPEWPVLPVANRLCRRICGYSLKEMNVRQKLAQSRWPILAFHGREDDFVPFHNLDEVVGCGKERVIEAYHIDGAAHCQSFNKDPGFYWKRVEDFLNRCSGYEAFGPEDFTALYHFEERTRPCEEDVKKLHLPLTASDSGQNPHKKSVRKPIDAGSE